MILAAGEQRARSGAQKKAACCRRAVSCLLNIGIILFLFGATAHAEEWRELKGENFIVYYFEDAAFAREVLTRAERYYQKIASDLGYTRFDNFWQWENRAKIYLYRNHAEFLEATGKNAWVHGAAFYEKREIISYKWEQGFLDSLLPHELSHLIFRDFVGFKGEVPLWLDEGVAQWEETQRRKLAIDAVKKLIAEKSYIPLRELTQVGHKSESDPVLTGKLYVQAVSLVGFLIEQYGPSRFVAFCRQLRDGKNIDAALSFVYTDSISNMETLQKKWVQYYGGS